MPTAMFAPSRLIYPVAGIRDIEARALPGAVPPLMERAGAAAAALAPGDRVWLRHTKAGELSEHVNEFALVDGDRIVDTMLTYRGEGKAFL